MLEQTEKRLKKFQKEHEIYLSAQDLKSYWAVTTRIPQKGKAAHRVRSYVTSREEEGNVLVLPDPDISGNYTVENWGKMNTFDDYLNKALDRILEDLDEFEQITEKQGCVGCD